MANIGDTVSFTASKYKNLFVSDDKRYTIAYFTVMHAMRDYISRKTQRQNNTAQRICLS